MRLRATESLDDHLVEMLQPFRYGGLGLKRVTSISPIAYHASIMNSLTEIRKVVYSTPSSVKSDHFRSLLHHLGQTSLFTLSMLHPDHTTTLIPGSSNLYSNSSVRAIPFYNWDTLQHCSMPFNPNQIDSNSQQLGSSAWSSYSPIDSNSLTQSALSKSVHRHTHSVILNEATARVNTNSTSFRKQFVIVNSTRTSSSSSRDDVVPAKADLIRLSALRNKDTRRWLTVIPDSYDLFMSDVQFVAALKMRYNMQQNVISHSCNCPSAHASNVLQLDASHFLSCSKLNFAWTDRHNAIRNCVAKHARLVGCSVRVEPTRDFILDETPDLTAKDQRSSSINIASDNDSQATDELNCHNNSSSSSSSALPQPEGAKDQERLDVYIQHLDGSFGVDVTVTHPSSLARSQRIKTSSALLKPLSAALSMVQHKKHRYRDLITKMSEFTSFVAFAAESFGGLCSDAHSLIDNISKLSDSPSEFRNSFLDRIAIVLQKGNADVLRHGCHNINKLNSTFSADDYDRVATSLLQIGQSSSLQIANSTAVTSTMCPVVRDIAAETQSTRQRR